MSEKLDYVNARVENAQQEKLDFLLGGNFTADNIQFIRGYLKAMQDVIGFQQDYTSIKNKPKQDDE